MLDSDSRLPYPQCDGREPQQTNDDQFGHVEGEESSLPLRKVKKAHGERGINNRWTMCKLSCCHCYPLKININH